MRGVGEVKRLRRIFLIMSGGRVRMVDLKAINGTLHAEVR